MANGPGSTARRTARFNARLAQARKPRKVRQYAFGASNADTRQHGTMFITAKNLDEAEAHRWYMHQDPSNPIKCAGYVGPMSGSTWVPENEVRGFVDGDTLQAEREATYPVIEHDPADLAEFVEKFGREPRQGARIKRNMLNPNGGPIEVAHGTPISCDPSSETYHSM